MSGSELRWGVVGTGWIAGMFVNDILAPRASGPAKHVLGAAGTTSSIEKAEKFIDAHWKGDGQRPKAYGSYQEVYDAPDIDIIYIATPHSLHKQNCLDAIKAGKHVLCEKPFTINSKEGEEVVAAAKAKGVFLMEAVWTRFFPLTIELEKKIQEGAIGRVWRSIIQIGFGGDWDALPASSRLKDPALGGGALLDLCVYPISYSSLIFGRGQRGEDHPEVKVTSSMDIANGADEADVVTLQYKTPDNHSQTAVCIATVLANSPRDFGRIEGKEGSITLYTELGPSCPTGFRVTNAKGEEEDFPFTHAEGTFGFIYEADAVAQDIFAGRTESARMPLAETLRVMRLLDQIRGQNGLVYPQDQV
ncbi:hypothetical protein B0J13DRAFT_492135 [Dactylonectria estremocensis]|uniref:D-xylose 1-dehydrogenase (NADP(+), D-xylono-1,5-lactone-forming) n=1 Tax=Dactylonectria estremocensis TaxID=1079267 RepID=A0A9P9FIV9_9HYPO|nr:hypothetical protein B0J13DRAFT_492135 [Dactylonectria estremocensis]